MKNKEERILGIILSEFPGLRAKITSKYLTSSSFLEACEDYVICLRSIERLRSKKSDGTEEEIKELSAALKDLKEEIMLKIIT